MTEITNTKCPCGLGEDYAECCGQYIDGGKLAPEPESLMRSRYTAFALQKIDYLKKTWHPETLPDDLDDSEPNCWVSLEIVDASMDDEEIEGEVEFIAKLIYNNKLEVLHEISQFDKVNGHWLYHSGEFKEPDAKAQKLSKSERCPCGSGRSFKNCHFVF